MIISFDLDDTLIPGAKNFATERRNVLQKILGTEPLRLGTKNLIKLLQSKGHKIYVYTTSFRSTPKIWWIFFLYGIKLHGIINQRIHEATLKERAKNHSKYPPIFGIDIHIDDSKGVEIEGHRHNFKTIIVSETDVAWVNYILAKIELN